MRSLSYGRKYKTQWEGKKFFFGAGSLMKIQVCNNMAMCYELFQKPMSVILHFQPVCNL